MWKKVKDLGTGLEVTVGPFNGMLGTDQRPLSSAPG